MTKILFDILYYIGYILIKCSFHKGNFIMPRIKKPRFVSIYPTITAFVPRGMFQTGEITLSLEGLEAIRLSDFEHLDQETAAKRMEVSRQTYGRILSEARGIVSEALVTGKALIIEGGSYEMRGRHRKRRRRGGREF
jgi:predicted DNA-binding protein (UPF0251 family)